MIFLPVKKLLYFALCICIIIPQQSFSDSAVDDTGYPSRDVSARAPYNRSNPSYEQLFDTSASPGAPQTATITSDTVIAGGSSSTPSGLSDDDYAGIAAVATIGAGAIAGGAALAYNRNPGRQLARAQAELEKHEFVASAAKKLTRERNLTGDEKDLLLQELTEQNKRTGSLKNKDLIALAKKRALLHKEGTATVNALNTGEEGEKREALKTKLEKLKQTRKEIRAKQIAVARSIHLTRKGLKQQVAASKTSRPSSRSKSSRHAGPERALYPEHDPYAPSHQPYPVPAPLGSAPHESPPPYQSPTRFNPIRNPNGSWSV